MKVWRKRITQTEVTESTKEGGTWVLKGRAAEARLLKEEGQEIRLRGPGAGRPRRVFGFHSKCNGKPLEGLNRSTTGSNYIQIQQNHYRL